MEVIKENLLKQMAEWTSNKLANSETATLEEMQILPKIAELVMYCNETVTL